MATNEQWTQGVVVSQEAKETLDKIRQIFSRVNSRMGGLESISQVIVFSGDPTKRAEFEAKAEEQVWELQQAMSEINNILPQIQQLITDNQPLLETLRNGWEPPVEDDETSGDETGGGS